MSAPRRLIVLGAGAIGAPIGAMLAERGLNVVLVARGAHGDALRTHGLDLRLPQGPRRLRAPTVPDLSQLDPTPADLVLLAVMSQHTLAAVGPLSPDVPIASLQNGVEAPERLATRGHPLIVGTVWVAAERRGPGVVALSGSPVPGAVLLGPWGRHPEPAAWTHWLVLRLRDIGLRAARYDDAAPWSRAKLLSNLAGIAVALCDDPPEDLLQAAQAEAKEVWTAAGLPFGTPEALRGEVGDIEVVEVDGRPRVGGSTRHALVRGQPLETASLHRPIVEQGRRLGVPTPVNAALITLADRAHAEGWTAGSLTPEALWAEVRATR